ncbi:MAG: sulfotransferase, partial [Thiogranum sp.]
MTKDIVISGIPRSGTSYLCSILNKTRNTVVINEPEEVFQILRNNSEAALSRYYEHMRNRINNGQPITNKLANGKFIEDTNILNARTAYTPHVDTTDFVLGTKNTLVYLNTLKQIIESLPEATLVACVRHPYDTIASWSKVSFPHIRDAKPQFLLDYTTGKEKLSIDSILKKTSLAIRYAMWWNYLAGIINSNRDRFILINYESMVSNPEATLA